MEEKKVNKKSTAQKSLTVIGIVLCVLLVPILIVNCTMIIKSMFNKDEIPSFCSLMPMIVKTDSMNPEFFSGDLIIVKKTKPTEIEKNDVITFFEPKGSGLNTVTHRVIEVIDNGDGTVSFKTKGDNNNTADAEPVAEGKLVGKYLFSLRGLGNVALFMQSTLGLVICILLPLVLFIGYDLLRRKLYDKSQQQDTEALLSELEALKAEKEQINQNQPAVTAQDETKIESSGVEDSSLTDNKEDIQV